MKVICFFSYINGRFENVFAKLLDICGVTFDDICTERKHFFSLYLPHLLLTLLTNEMAHMYEVGMRFDVKRNFGLLFLPYEIVFTFSV